MAWKAWKPTFMLHRKIDSSPPVEGCAFGTCDIKDLIHLFISPLSRRNYRNNLLYDYYKKKAQYTVYDKFPY